MDIFYIIVPSIAICLLILILGFIGVKMAGNNGGKLGSSVTAFPPQSGTCPDLWTIQGNSCIWPQVAPFNGTNTILSASAAVVPAGATKFGSTGINFTASTSCDLKNWANSNNVLWDGITNYNGCD